MKSGFAALLLCCAAVAAPAQEFPSRTVHLIVPYTPGTGGDILARVLAPKFSERWKAAVVVENRPGATGNIGTEAVAKSAPDGHTLLLAATSLFTNPALAKTVSDRPAALMRGHGAVVVGETLARAVGRSVYLELSARMQMQALLLAQGGRITYLDASEVAASMPVQDYNRAWPMWRAQALERAAREKHK